VRDDGEVTRSNRAPGERRRRNRLAFGGIAVLAIAAGLLLADRVASNPVKQASRSPGALSTPISSPGTGGGVGPATAVPEPTFVPGTVELCGVNDVALAASGWSGATGSMAGRATVINVSTVPCEVSGTPHLELLASGGGRIASGSAHVVGSPVTLVPGGSASVTMVWSNWCGNGRLRPLTLQMSLAGIDGAIQEPIVAPDQPGVIGGPSANSVPRCDVPSLPSSIDAVSAFAAPEPPQSSGDAEACAASQLAGYLGSWGAAAGTSYANVVVLNRGPINCLLAISPPLELRDADASVVATAEPWQDADATFELPAGWTGLTTIGFADWCMAKPKLPFQLDLRIGRDQLAVMRTSARSSFATPTCNSAPATPPPTFFYDGPFAIPGLNGGD
jgi:hypothetical protein